MNQFTDLGNGHQLRYRVNIDNLRGAGDTPTDAICAALSAGGKIPAGMRDRKETSGYLFWHYEASHQWLELIRALEHNEFPEQQDMPDDIEDYYNQRAEQMP